MGTKVKLNAKISDETLEKVDFSKIKSCTTEHFIGFETCLGWMLFRKSNDMFFMVWDSRKEEINSLDELNAWVYKHCEEYINEVFEHQMYKVEMIDKE